MRPRQHTVELTTDERNQLEKSLTSGKAVATDLTHARILLKADQGASGPAWSDADIAEALDVSVSTVGRVRRRFATEGLAAAVKRAPSRRVYERKLDGVQEAHLIALACSTPPEGQDRWSLRLLADKLVELEHVESISYGTVRRVLEKTNSSRG
jgi:transposase